MAALEEVKEVSEETGQLPPDPMDAVEKKLRDSIIETSKAMLTELAEAITPETAPRALRVGENISKHTRKLLSELGLGNMLDTHRRKTLSGYTDVAGLDDDTPSYLSVGGGSNLETFGAQFAQQLGSSLKQITDVFSPSTPATAELSLVELLEGIKAAKEMEDAELENKLQAKVDSLLAKNSGIIDAEFGVLPSAPPPDPVVEDIMTEAVQQTMEAGDATTSE